MDSNSHQDVALLALWEQVESKFDDGGIHAAFLAACDEKKNLAFAATRYRAIKDGGDEQRAAIAGRQLDAITALAMSQLEAARSIPHTPKRTITIIAAIVSFGLIGFCIYLIGM